jgi:hypothetical protein
MQLEWVKSELKQRRYIFIRLLDLFLCYKSFSEFNLHKIDTDVLRLLFLENLGVKPYKKRTKRQLLQN